MIKEGQAGQAGPRTLWWGRPWCCFGSVCGLAMGGTEGLRSRPKMGGSIQFISFAGTERSGVARHPWEQMTLWYPDVPCENAEFWKPIHLLPPATGGKGNTLSGKECSLEAVFVKLAPSVFCAVLIAENTEHSSWLKCKGD